MDHCQREPNIGYFSCQYAHAQLRSSENFWSPECISHTQTNAQHHQMHDPPDVHKHSPSHFHTHAHTLHIHTCEQNTLYVYTVVILLVYPVYIYTGGMHSHTWSWIFVLETASVSLHSAPIHSDQPYPNVMHGISLSSVKVQWHHSWISWGCLFLKYQLSWLENSS